MRKRRSKSSRKAWIYMVLSLCLSVCTGCASGGQEDQERRMTKKEKLVLWTYYETENQKISMDELANGFNQSQKEYELTWEYHGPVTEFNKSLAIAITQNQLPDLVILDNSDMHSYIKMGKLEDITSAVSKFGHLDDYFPNVMESVKYQGKYYGLPLCCNNVALIYNKDLLEEKGIRVPQTRAELKHAAKELTDADAGRYGFAMSAIDDEQGAFQFGTHMVLAGDSLEQAGGEGTKKALQFIQTMTENGWMSRKCVNWSQNDVAKIFLKGECAMMENGPWVFPKLDESGIHYGVAAFPGGGEQTGLLGGEDLAVIKGKNVRGSIAFLNYYSQADVMLNINLRANSLPPRRDVAQIYLNVKPQFQVILQQMDGCVSRAVCENWSELSRRLSNGIYRVITGESTPEQVCREIRSFQKE